MYSAIERRSNIYTIYILYIFNDASIGRTISAWSGFARIIERDPPILSLSKVLCLRHVTGEILLRKFVHLDTDLSQFDHVRVEIHEIQDLSKSDRESR